VQIIVTIMADGDRRFGRHGGVDHNEAQPVFHPFLSRGTRKFGCRHRWPVENMQDG
jgi:hypothetical protein